MAEQRPNIFDDNLQLDRFKPKTDAQQPVPAEIVERVSAENGFQSRAPKPRNSQRTTASSKRSTIVRSIYVVPLNARVSHRGHEHIHELLEAEWDRYERGEITHRVTLGELVERAFAALDREMEPEAKKK